jgi:hypothetical protein
MYYLSEDLYNYRNRLFNVLLLVIAGTADASGW